MSFVDIDTSPDPDIGGRRMARTIEIDSRQFTVLERLFATNPSVRAAYEALCKALLSGGIRITKGGDATLAPEFQEEVNCAWVAFCKNVLANLFVYGFAIIGLTPDKRPYTEDPMDLRIQIRVFPKGVRKYRIFRYDNLMGLNPMKPAADLYVFERDAPDMRGRLTSILRSLLHTQTFALLMMACAARAEQRRSEPPLITQTQKPTVDASNMARDMLVMGDHEEFKAMDDDQRLVQRVRYTADEEVMFREMNRNVHRRTTNRVDVFHPDWVDIDPVTDVPRYPLPESSKAYANNRIPLGPNQTVATHTMAAAPEYLIQLLEISEADVGKATGVPRNIWGSELRAVATNLIMLNTFYATQQHYRVLLGFVLRRMLEEAYPEQNLAQTVRSAVKARLQSGKAGASSSSSSSPAPSKSPKNTVSDIHISFPGLLDPQVLRDLRESGVMEFDTYCEYLSNYYGIPRSDLAKEPIDPLTGETVKSVEQKKRKMEEENHQVDVQMKKAKLLEAKDQNGPSGGSSGGGGGGDGKKGPPSLKSSSKTPVGKNPPKSMPRD